MHTCTCHIMYSSLIEKSIVEYIINFNYTTRQIYQVAFFSKMIKQMWVVFRSDVRLLTSVLDFILLREDVLYNG